MLIHEVLPEMFAKESLNPGLIHDRHKFIMPADPAGKSQLRLVFPAHDLEMGADGRPLIAYRHHQPFGDAMLEYELGGALGMMQFEMMSGLFHQYNHPTFIMANSRQVHGDLVATPDAHLHDHLAVVVRWLPGCRPANFGADHVEALLFNVLWYEYVAPASAATHPYSVTPTAEEQETDIFVLEYQYELRQYFGLLEAMYRKAVAESQDALAVYAIHKEETRQLVEREIIAHLRPEVNYELRENDYLVWLPDGSRRWLRYDPKTVYQDKTYLMLDGVMAKSKR